MSRITSPPKGLGTVLLHEPSISPTSHRGIAKLLEELAVVNVSIGGFSVIQMGGLAFVFYLA